METNSWTRGASVFGSCYIKRWLEGKYDQLADLPAVAKLKAVSPGAKLGIEAILYTLTAYAEQKLTDQSPLGLMAKTVLMDAAPEIASRLMDDARADLIGASAGESSLNEPQKNVATKLLALPNKELLGVLVSMEEMDEVTLGKFLSFASGASDDELAKFSTLSPNERMTLLGAHDDGRRSSSGGWTTDLKSFAGDFWVVFKAWSRKSNEIALPLLNRYILGLLWLLKVTAILWAVAFLVCTASSIFGKWTLFVILLGMVGAGIMGILWGKQTQRSWVVAASTVAAAVVGILALLTASGYADSVFGVAVLFLVGLPTLAIGGLLIPVTMAMEILRSLFPEGHRTLVRAAQMLLSAFFGILFLSVVILIFPPQNPVAFLFVVPITIALALGAGFGLTRANPAMFLRTPVLLGFVFVFLATVGVMSMPNLRNKLRTLPTGIDRALVAGPKQVHFDSSKSIEFVTHHGEAKIWYAERPNGGYDLFRCDGIGPYYAPDGRRLSKADNDSIRQKISMWVDGHAMKLAEEQRIAENQRLEAQRKAEMEAATLEEQQRQAEIVRQEEESAKADLTRRESYLISTNLPSKVVFMICVASPDNTPMDQFASLLATQLQEGGKHSSSAVFSSAFVTGGGFGQFFAGKGGEDIKNMPLAEMGGKILLARCEQIDTRPSETVSGLFTVNVQMSFRVLSAIDGSILNDFNLTGVGPGTGKQAAETAAMARIIEQVVQRNLQ